MKILFAPTHYMLESTAGGSEFSWASNIVRSLAARPGVEIVAITGVARELAPFPPNVRLVRLDHKARLHLTWAYRFLFVWRTYWAARRVLRTERVDVVHHFLPFGLNVTFSLLPLLGTLRKVPFVLGPLQAPHTYASDEEFVIYSQRKFTKYTSVRDMFQDQAGFYALYYARRLFKCLSTATLRRSAALTAINEETKRLYMREAPGIHPHVIPPGIHVAAFRGEQSGSGAEGDEIVSVGSLIKRKGVDVIIKAMAEMKRTHPHLRLRIIGEGPQRQALEALARELGVEDSVIFQGFVPNAEIAPFYRAASLYVTMSYSESFGQTMIEAMAAGLCVVAAENVGARGIVDDGQTGFLVQPGDVPALVQVLRRMCDNPSLRAAIGAEAQRVAAERYDWSVIALRYMDLYKSLRPVAQ